MQTLSENYTQQELDRALSFVGCELDLNEANGVYSMWRGDKYCGGFGDLDSVAEELNLRISMKNSAAEANEQERLALAEALQDASPAVLLNSAGKPVYQIDTPARGGEYVEVAGGTTADGTPVNRRNFKVSRNKKFMREELPIAAPALDKFGDLYYLAEC